MRVAVMGAGAVGCYYGGLLARAGHAVVLIGRADHVAAMRRDGLVMDLPEGRIRVPVQADEQAQGVQGAELVLVCVKSSDTESAGEAMAPHLAPQAQVLSLQNGVDNAERLARVLGRPVHPAVVYVASAMAGPGHVSHQGRGELVLPADAALDPAVQALVHAGIPVERSPAVAQALWSKLVLNCAWNALSAITRLPYGRIAKGQGVEDALREVVDECLAVAAAEGIGLQREAVWAAVQRIGQTMPQQHSSTAQDLARGRRSEIDHLNGLVVRKGRAHDVPTPANRLLWLLVRLIEDPPA